VHTLTDDVQVANGVTLTIKPGATVEGEGHTIQIGGDLEAVGLPTHHITLTDLNINYLPDNDPAHVAHIDISHADITGGSFLNPTGDAVYGSFSLTDSVVQGWGGYSYIWYPQGANVVQHNAFFNSGGFSVGEDLPGSMTIEANAFVNQTSAAISVWADYRSAPLVITENSFLTNGLIALETTSTAPSFSAPENWFGTTSYSAIEKMIIDGHDDLTLPIITLGPSPAAPSPNAPIIGSDTAATDSLLGSKISDIIVGQGASDDIQGGGGEDSLYGGAGNDRLNGGGGNDWLSGGDGRDKFIFSGAFGHDYIADFAATGAGHDRIEFSVNDFADFTDLQAHMVQSGGDVLITALSGSSVLLHNETLASLTSSDFIFH
jgi:hypothetical protein